MAHSRCAIGIASGVFWGSLDLQEANNGVGDAAPLADVPPHIRSRVLVQKEGRVLEALETADTDVRNFLSKMGPGR
jgi:hypothetical protein